MRTKLFLTVLAAVCCNCGGSDYTISGRLDLLPGDSVCLWSVYPADSVIQTGVVAVDSTFTLKGRIREPLVARLEVLGQRNFEISPVFVEPGTIYITCSEADVPMVCGTPMNDSLAAMQAERASLREEAIRQSERREALLAEFNQIPGAFVSRNWDKLLGVFIFATEEYPQYGADSLGAATAKGRMAQFAYSLQPHPLLQRIREEIAAIENTAIGSSYTDLTLTNAAGQPIALSSLVEGRQWVLLNFWAAWSFPSLREIPYLGRAHASFRNKGFEIYGVSLDNDIARWNSCLVENKMAWINVQGVTLDKQSLAVDLYGIRSIPQNFLISPEGVIVAKNLYGEALEEKLKTVIP